jgi:hypothetical protein
MFQEMEHDAYSRHFFTRLVVLVAVSASLLDSSSTADSTEEPDQEARPGNVLKGSRSVSVFFTQTETREMIRGTKEAVTACYKY